MRHDWPVNKAIVDLPISLRGNSKGTVGNSSSLMGAQNKDIGATSQTLLSEVKLCLGEGYLLSSMAFWYHVSDKLQRINLFIYLDENQWMTADHLHFVT